MFEKVTDVLRTGSKVNCVYKSVSGFVIAFIFIIIAIILIFIKTDKRLEVNVKIDSATSSHELEEKTIKQVDSNEEIVQGTRVSGTSTESCTEHTYSNGSRQTKCDCNGYTFKYKNATAECLGHTGKCKRNNTHKMIYNNVTQSLRCKGIKDKIECKITFDDDSTLTCPYDSHCPQTGQISVVKNKSNGQYSCLIPNENWNTCTLILNHKGKKYPSTELSNASCENLKGSTKSLYYSKKHDDFKKTYSDPTILFRIIALILFIIAIVMSIHSWALIKFEAYCHASNISQAIGMVTGRGRRQNYNDNKIVHTRTSSNTFRAEY